MRGVVALWPLFDPAQLDKTWAAIRPTALQIIEVSRTRSVSLAESYYREVRLASGIRAALPRIVLPVEGWQTAALVSLEVTGPVLTKSAIAAKQPIDRIIQNALVRVTGTVSRHALEGGRLTVGRYAKADHAGYRRVTSGSPCGFCAMLAGRGAVYGSATVTFRAHDHCSCSSEPVFRARPIREAYERGRGT